MSIMNTLLIGTSFKVLYTYFVTILVGRPFQMRALRSVYKHEHFMEKTHHEEMEQDANLHTIVIR